MRYVLQIDPQAAGEVYSYDPDEHGPLTLDEIQSFAKARYVEIVSRGDDLDFVIDEEGLLKHSPALNVVATHLAGQPLVGTVAVVSREGSESVGLTEQRISELLATLDIVFDDIETKPL